MNKKDVLSRLALLLATIIWGAAFVVMKTTLDSVPTGYLLTIRFLGASAILAIVFCTRLKKLDRGYWIGGLCMGVCLFFAYYFQTLGLALTTPGKNSFLTATYCIIVPFMAWAVYKRRPDINNITAALICLVGMGLVSLTEDLSVGMGDVLTIICGFFFAGQIICIDHFTKERDPVVLTILQFLVTGLMSLVVALFTESFPRGFSSQAVLSLGYLCVFSTALALLLQTVGQKGTPPATASIILSLEAVFGVVFSVIFYHEDLTLRMVVGFVLIFAAVLISETKPMRGSKRLAT